MVFHQSWWNHKTFDNWLCRWRYMSIYNFYYLGVLCIVENNMLILRSSVWATPCGQLRYNRSFVLSLTIAHESQIIFHSRANLTICIKIRVGSSSQNICFWRENDLWIVFDRFLFQQRLFNKFLIKLCR